MLKVMHKNIVKKCLDLFRDNFKKVYEVFGRNPKLGIHDPEPQQACRVLKLLLHEVGEGASFPYEGMFSISPFVLYLMTFASRCMHEDQKSIYYFTGESGPRPIVL
jgi:HSP90 family molecular chaperone